MIGTCRRCGRETVTLGWKETGMPWRNLTWYPFSERSVLLNAPHEPGVYALFNKKTWVYVGEAKISARN
jgi:hypothetical protein